MNQTSILFPAMALIGWTMTVLLLVPYRRFRAAFAHRVTVEDFRLGESANVPDEVRISNRNYMNLLEVPVLFYVISLIHLVTATSDRLVLEAAWTYVGSRVMHSLVHLTYNDVYHRLALFATSNVVLVLMWGRLLWRLVG